MVNIVVGGWWTFALFSSLFMVRKIPYKDQHPAYDGEPLLVDDQASPVGFKVPSIPDFEIDPGLASTGIPCFSLRFEFIVGILMAIGVGGSIIYFAFTSWDENIVGEVQGYTGGIL
jgi:hypothetical protein